MNTTNALILSLGLVLLFSCKDKSAQQAPETQAPQDLKTPDDIRKQRAEALVDDLLAGKTEKACTHFDANMRKGLPAANLAVAWAQNAGALGEFQRCEPVHTKKQGAYDIVFVPCLFEKGVLTTKVVFNAAQEVAGLFFLKGDMRYKAAPYVQADKFRCRQVKVGEAPFILPGTLCLPLGPGPYPGLVLVHGSGPNDRDESIGANKPFRDLAEGLASKGVAVLRYDKRTKVHPDKLDAKLTMKEEVTDDAIAAAKVLAATEAVVKNRIFVLGHSLGGMLLPRILRDAPEGLLAGGIVLAGSTRPFGTMIMEQHRYLMEADGALSSEEKQHLAIIKAQVERFRAPDLAKSIEEGPLPYDMGLAYAKDLRAADPVGTAAALDFPLFILQGERDYQVTMEDYLGWKKSLDKKKNVRFKTYPALNHLFIPGSGKSLPAEYQRPGHVDATVISDIKDWMAAVDP